MERKERLVLFLIALTIAASLYYSGHRKNRNGSPVAFLRYTSGQIIVRVKGDVPAPGLYRFPEQSTMSTVIKLTAPSLGRKGNGGGAAGREMKNGDVIRVAAQHSEIVGIESSRMGAQERILLGIPLVPDEMDRSDWESLPGIGPELAEAIMEYRQKNGDIGSLESLQKVRGIGKKKINAIKGYFQQP